MYVWVYYVCICLFLFLRFGTSVSPHLSLSLPSLCPLSLTGFSYTTLMSLEVSVLLFPLFLVPFKLPLSPPSPRLHLPKPNVTFPTQKLSTHIPLLLPLIWPPTSLPCRCMMRGLERPLITHCAHPLPRLHGI